MADDTIQDRACLDLARPANEAWYAPSTLPIGVLLASERRVRAVRPRVVLRPVVGRVHDNGVVGDSQFFELVEYHPDLLVMDDHAIAIRVLSALTEVFFCDMGPKMHSRRVIPQEERLLLLCLLLHPFESAVGNLFVDGFHAFLGQRAGINDGLPALAIGETVKHTAGSELLPEFRVLGIVGQLRFFLGVEVIEIAEEFIEAMHSWQEFIPVPEMVLAELAGGVAEWLEKFGDCRVFLLQSNRGSRHADLGQARADRVLTGDEAGATGGAALLRIIVGEGHSLGGKSVNVGGPVAHHAAIEMADVPDADVVPPEDEDVRLT